MAQKSKNQLALLLNLFVYPGVGQLHVGRKHKGWFFILTTSILLLGFLLGYQVDLYHQVQILHPRLNQPGLILNAIKGAFLARWPLYVFGFTLTLTLWFWALVDILLSNKITPSSPEDSKNHQSSL